MKLFLVGEIVLESFLIEEVAVVGRLLDDFQGHFEVGVLELDDEVGEDLIAVLRNVVVLPHLPELFGYPACNRTQILQVIQVLLYINNLICKYP